MKNFTKKIFFVASLMLVWICSGPSAFAQCGNDNTQFGATGQLACNGVWNTLTTCIYGGEFRTVDVTCGQRLQFQTCGNTAFDTQISIYNNATGAYVGAGGYNDDACGLQSYTAWTANFTGTIRVLVDQFNCISNTTCMTLQGRCVSNNGQNTQPTSITASTNNICPGSAVTLTQSGGSLGTGGNFFWYTGGCGVSQFASGNAVTVNPTSTTTYFCRAEGAFCGTTGCAQVTINVINPNAPTISCPGNQVLGTNNNGIGDCAAQLTWPIPTYTYNCGGQAIPGMIYLGTFGGNYYYRSAASFTWPNASNDAILRGGRLAEITSAAENAQLDAWANGPHLFGYTDLANEGTWVSQFGIPAVYTNWGAGEPNNGAGAEHYLEVNLSSANWNDVLVTTQFPYVLEIGVFQTSGPALNSTAVTGTNATIGYTAFTPGGSATCSFNVSVVDNELPTIACPASFTQNVDPGTCGAVANYATPIAVDNCAPVTVTLQSGLASGSVFPLGTTAVTYLATDPSGNTATCSFGVTITETTPPTITCPANITQNVDAGNCGAVVTFTVGVSDNCVGGFGANRTMAFEGASVFGPVYSEQGMTINAIDHIDAPWPVAGGVSGARIHGGYTSTWTYGGGQPFSPKSVMIQSLPNEHRFVSSTGATLTPGGLGMFTFPNTPDWVGITSLQWNSLGAGNIDIDNFVFAPGGTLAPTLVSGLGSGATFPVGTTPVTYSVTDASGNSSSCSFSVTVVDNQAPVITCPANVLVLTPSCSGVANFSATATDNCPGTVITYSQNSGTVFPVGVTVVTATATDAAGNTATCSFNVTVRDDQAPTFTNCGGAYTISIINGATFFDMVSWSLTDAFGATVIGAGPFSAGTYNVNVNGANAPFTFFAETQGQFNDNVLIFNITCNGGSIASGTVFGGQATTVNNVCCGTAGCPPNLVLGAGQCDGIPTFQAFASDDCGSTVITYSPYSPGDVFPIGVTTVTATATDLGGNTATCSFNVTVSTVAASISGAPATPVCLGTTLTLNAPGGGANNFYIRSANGNPWSQTTNQAAMTAAFGGNWTETFFSTLNPATVFAPSTRVVYIDGSDAYSDEMEAFLNTNIPTIQGWVSAGGRLFLNAAPNVGNGMSYGFGGVTLNYPNLQPVANAVNAAHPIFNGPALPVGTSFSGNSYSHATVSGGGITSLLNVGGASCLAELAFGGGRVLFGGMTTTNFHSPAPNGANLRANILSYLNSLPPAAGQLTYQWSNGGTTSTITEVVNANTTYSLTVTNLNGCTSSATVTVTIETTPPVLTCPSDIVVGNTAGACDAVVNFAATAVDDCAVTLTYTPASGSVFAVGTTPVTVLATDASGNTSSCAFNVTVNDTELPTLTCPGTGGAAYAASIAGYAPRSTAGFTGLGVISGCDDCVENVALPFPFTFYGNTYNTAQVSSNGFLSFTLSGNPACCVGLPIPAPGSIENFIALWWTDLLPGAGISYGTDGGDFVVNFDNIHISSGAPTRGQIILSPNGTITLVSDVMGNGGNVLYFHTQGIENIDGSDGIQTYYADNNTSYPGQRNVVYTPGNLGGGDTLGVVAANGNCEGIVPDFTALVPFADNCPGATIAQTPAPGSSVGLGTSTVTFTVTDASGNTASCFGYVEVEDVTGPAIACPADITVGNDAGICGAVVTFDVTATDNCGAATITQTFGLVSGTVFPVGVTVIGFEAVDVAGNTSTCAFNVVVNDTEAPVFNNIVAPAAVVSLDQFGRESTYTNVQLNGAGNVLSVAPNASVTLTANWTSSYTNGAGCPGCITQHWIGIDNIFADCHEAGFGAGSINQTFNAPATPGVYYIAQAPSWWFFCGEFGVQSIPNDANAAIAVLVVGGGATGCPGDIVLTADAGQCTAVANFTADATDNCVTPTITYSANPGTAFPVGTTFVTVTATDAAGNATTCGFNVTVNDLEVPVITCPADITVFNDAGACNAAVTYMATATDNCDANAAISYDFPSGSIFPVGTTLVTATATDASGNASTCAFNVTVNLTPLLYALTTVDAVCGNGGSASIMGTAGVAPYSYAWSTGETTDQVTNLAVGGYSVTVTDNCGQTISETFTINAVQDLDGPVLTCPSDITVFNDANACTAVVSYMATAADNCDANPVITYDIASGTAFNAGTTLVTVTATDASGNVSTCAFNVTVNLTPLVYTLAILDGSCGNGGSASVAGNFGIPPYSYVWSNGETTDQVTNLAAGNYTVTVSDNCGQTISEAFSINVSLGLVVTATPTDEGCPNAADGTVVVTVAGETAPVTYAWGNGATTQDITGLMAGNYMVTATDAAGCTGMAMATVAPGVDNTPPSVTCLPTQTIGGLGNVLLPDYTLLVGTADNCGAVTLVQSPAAGTNYGASQTVTVSLTATDAYGNTALCTFSVDVVISALVCVPDAAAVTWFVDDNAAGANNGTSWANAFTSLQSALAAASNGHNILVAEGTYFPTATINRNIAFDLKAGVDLYGGFPNGGTGPANPAVYASILSGNIGAIGSGTDNSNRVVRAINVGNNVTVCGFTIRDAYTTNSNGGGILVQGSGAGVQSSPNFQYCTVTANYSGLKGGGAFVYGQTNGAANPNFDYCVFSNNIGFSDGGALATISQTGGSVNVTISNSEFNTNSTPRKGGAIVNWLNASGTTVMNIAGSSFTGNASQGNGGAVFNYSRGGSSMTFNANNTDFINNAGAAGGAVYNYASGGPLTSSFTGCTFDANSANGSGGAVCTYSEFAGGNIAQTIDDCIISNSFGLEGGALGNLAIRGGTTTLNVIATRISDNVGNGRGGAIFQSTNGLGTAGTAATTNVVNTVFYQNISPNGPGGAIAQVAQANTTIGTTVMNSTFWGNSANGQGGVVFNSGVGVNAAVTITNSVFWANVSFLTVGKPFANNDATSFTNISYSLVEDPTCAGNAAGTGSFNCGAGMIYGIDPMFVDAANGDLHLMAGSAAIDAGTLVGAPGVDYDGNTRPQGNGVDMGAFEFLGIRPLAREIGEAPFTANLFPNPTTGAFTLALDREVTGFAQVFDLQGRLVATQQLNGNNQAQFDLATEASGMYLVRIVSGEVIVTKKVTLNKP